MNPEEKLYLTRIRIQKALRDHGPENCVVACSWGKDSVLILAFVREEYPNISVIHSNTGVDHPLTYRFRDRMVKEWDLNYHEVKGKMTYWQVIDKYGVQGVRLVDGERVPKCCRILKDDPAEEFYEENDIRCVFTGITADESRNRFMLMRRCGDYYFAKSQGRWKAHPIMDWTQDEVWTYIRQNDIPYNPFYDKFPGHRCGCVPCTSYLSWRENMAQENPKLYAKLSRMTGQELIDL